METKQLNSGLIVPLSKEDTEPKCKYYPPLELKRESDRAECRRIFLELWDLLNFTSGGGGIQLPPQQSREAFAAHFAFYNMFGDMLLGSAPQKEIKC